MNRSGSMFAIGLSSLALIVALSGRLGLPTAHAAVDGDKVGEARIAVVAAIRVMNDLMESERFKPAREELEATLRTEVSQIVDQGKSLEEKLKSIDQESDEARQIKQQLIGLQGALGKKQQELGIRYEKFVAEQTRDAYKLVRESAVGIAEDHGFTYVIASQSADDEIVAGPVAGLVNDVLGRPVMLAPADADLTEEVREDLKLE